MMGNEWIMRACAQAEREGGRSMKHEAQKIGKTELRIALSLRRAHRGTDAENRGAVRALKSSKSITQKQGGGENLSLCPQGL